jgi:hypothetical protein
MDKPSRLLALAKVRQAARWPPHKCIGDYHGGAYECEYVSPYSISAHNPDAAVMVILQDWASDGWLSGPYDQETQRLGYTPTAGTNVQLKRLLRQHLGLELAQTFATNLFPFVKMGAMNAPLPMRDLVKAARDFALPQIEIIQPKIAVCLGIASFNALSVAVGEKPAAGLTEAIDAPFTFHGTQVWCQAHTGRLGTNNRNKGRVDRVSSDWARMASEYLQLVRTIGAD